MSPLLNQFVTEARELLESAVEGLLALERTPGDSEVIARVFRSVHTLKGNAGFFDFAAIGVVVHAGEDLLDAVRDGALALNGHAVDELLRLCDLVGAWVDEVAQHGTLATHHQAAATACAQALRQHLPSAMAPGMPLPEADEGEAALGDRAGWLATASAETRAHALAAASAAGASEVVVGTYQPLAGCFFSGDDPCLTLLALPGLLASEIEFAQAPGPAATFDPYDCKLRLYFVCAAPVEAVAQVLRFVPEQVRYAVHPVEALAPVPDTAAQVREAAFWRLVEAQAACLAVMWPAGSEPASAMADPRLTPLRHVLTRALAVLDDAERAAQWAAVCDEADTQGNFRAIEQLLQRWLLERQRAVSGEPAAAVAVAAAVDPQTEAPPSLRDQPAAEPVLKPQATSTLVRVEQEKIDHLMDLIGELVVAKNGLPYLAQRAARIPGSTELVREIKDSHAVLHRIVQELQGTIMQVRMMPVSQVLQRFPRVVRDLARRLGKEVELHISGDQTEADKNVIEAMADPLVHLLRNAVDHGVEPPEKRRLAGKPAAGQVHIRAWQDSDQVCIEIADDGAGVDPVRVRAKAVERGLLGPDEAAALPDAEAVQLIFAAGFSTAEQVSDVSGRGVGMDVVRSSVERLGGRVHLSSEVGQGSRVRLSLPMSMAVSHVMAFRVGSQRFGVAMDRVVETLRVPADRVFTIKQQEAIVLRDRVVPLHRMRRLLGLPSDRSYGQGELAVLVVRALGEPVGLVIDAFDVGMETIVKPLEGVLSGLRALTGTALLGDGSVLLVVDPGALL